MKDLIFNKVAYRHPANLFKNYVRYFFTKCVLDFNSTYFSKHLPVATSKNVNGLNNKLFESKRIISNDSCRKLICSTVAFLLTISVSVYRKL